VLTLTTSALAQGTPSAADRGKAIGDTINAAITAAIPGGQAIATLLQGVFGNQAEKKVKKEDVQKALDDQSKKLRANAVAQLKGLSSAVDEITAANDLANLARVAYESLAGTSTLVTLPDDIGWRTFQGQWDNVAKPNLAKVTGFDAKKLGNISNENIQAEWQTFIDSYQQAIADISKYTGEKNAAFVAMRVSSLTTSLNKLSTIPSVELKAFARQLAGLANPSADAVQPPPPQPGKADDASVRSLLQRGRAQ